MGNTLLKYNLFGQQTAKIEHGGIAQLGERLNGIQEVSGSIPLISTKKRQKPIGFCLFFANGVGNLSDMWYTKPKGGAWERHFKRS